VAQGDRVVLEYCQGHSFPIPDAASGFCLYLPLAREALVQGATIRFEPKTNPAYLWQLRAPSRSVTSNVTVDAKVLLVSDVMVRIAVHGHTPLSADVQWSHHGIHEYPWQSALPREQHTF
jgi:hypothetical protein